MKKFFILIGLAISALGVQAQTRKYIGGFSQFSQVYNPALTGQQGSVLKTLYRDRWTGFDDAPRTLVFSGELNLADVKNHTLLATEAPEEAVSAEGVQSALGISLNHHTFGPLRESLFSLNYTTGVRLTESIRLQGGIGLTYDNARLDNEKLVFADTYDHAYASLMNGSYNNINKYGLNIGLALTSNNYYVGYAVQDLAYISDINSDDQDEYIKDVYSMKHNVQAGVRHGFTDQLGVVVNGMYRYNKNEEGVFEGQVKGVYNNFFWVGAGYRQDLAYTFSGGIRFKQLNISYLREVATGKSDNVMNNANEIMVSYNLAPVLTSVGNALTIW